jgi:large subunit ribosomal protein L21
MMEYAILEASGKQYWVEPGRFIEVNNLAIKAGTKILVRRVLFGRKEEEVLIGKPYLTQVKVEAVVGKDFLGPKLLIYKMKPKKKYRRKNGHRQQLTRLFIEKIGF